ncbi:hypothetical protein DAI22_08g145301 [Oryza sativa Japonica Group]|nr:hypothetical protein DAI22_08g145301 [Oryza sativa Japonica Group]
MLLSTNKIREIVTKEDNVQADKMTVWAGERLGRKTTIRRSCGRNTSTARHRTAQRVQILPVSVCIAACNNV